MENLIPLVAIIIPISGIVLVVYLVLLFSSRKAAKSLDTLVKLVEHGGQVEPEMLEMLNARPGPEADLRKGLVWLALGIPLTLGIAADGHLSEAVFGLIPVTIGIAYLVMMRYGMHRDGDNRG